MLAHPEQQLEQANRAAEHAEGEPDETAAARPGRGAATGGDVPGSCAQGHKQRKPEPRPMKTPVGAIKKKQRQVLPANRTGCTRPSAMTSGSSISATPRSQRASHARNNF